MTALGEFVVAGPWTNDRSDMLEMTHTACGADLLADDAAALQLDALVALAEGHVCEVT